jgi:serine/threonine protein kinase/WD40 repeat protein
MIKPNLYSMKHESKRCYGVDSLIGTTLGGYKLTRAIGSGGMGTVYLAEDQSVGQQVAIKIVRTEDDDFADMSKKEKAIERFKHEARTIAALDHLHILPLYRYGEEKVLNSVRAYMVMQYRPEGSLWDWLRKRAGQALGESSPISNSSTITPLPAGLPTNWPLSVTEVADYLQQASSALQYAHDHGIIHRDVKPANFLLRFDSNHVTNTTHAFLFLSDFGLAKFSSSSSATSHVLGTPMYMAPEQFYSNARPESDQYALAIMIYYMLAGHPPFTGEPARMMHQHLNVAPPPLRTFAPDLPSSIEATLNRALAKQMQDRYPSVEAFAEDFLQCINDPTQLSPIQFSPSRPLILTNKTPVVTPPAFSTPAGMPAPIPQPQSRPYSGSQASNPAAFAPTVMPSPPANLPPTLFVPTPSNPTPLAQPAYPAMQSWDHDATIQQIGPMPKPPPNIKKNKSSRRRVLGWLIGGGVAAAMGAGAGIYLYQNWQPANAQPQSTNPPKNTAQVVQPTPQTGATARYTLSGHTNEVSSISWSPNGDHLASGSLDNSVRVWNLATQQTDVTYTGHMRDVTAVAWSRDAQTQLIASGSRDNSVQVWNSTTGEEKLRDRNLNSEVSSLAWTGNDMAIFIGTLGAGLQEIFVNRKFATQLGLKGVIDTIALSPDGRFLAVGFGGGMVNILSLPSGRLFTSVNRRTNAILGLAWSPASNLLAIGGSDQRVDILNIATRSTVQSTPTNSVVNGLSWEPNNSGRLAIANNDGTISIWNTVNNTLTPGTGHTGPVRAVAWGNRYLASASADQTIIVWNV